ncbi:unnamed protein product [Ambrosiozyma monospora]|uniref:Unnamed protein product n=1 Tax=Ambrosiozyma monospora TaxID=43982 RepID=A0A9W6Z0A5_AMBMO|nr:unnamed protein product [Ambrosiozyma monospora]
MHDANQQNFEILEKDILKIWWRCMSEYLLPSVLSSEPLLIEVIIVMKHGIIQFFTVLHSFRPIIHPRLINIDQTILLMAPHKGEFQDVFVLSAKPGQWIRPYKQWQRQQQQQVVDSIKPYYLPAEYTTVNGYIVQTVSRLRKNLIQLMIDSIFHHCWTSEIHTDEDIQLDNVELKRKEDFNSIRQWSEPSIRMSEENQFEPNMSNDDDLNTSVIQNDDFSTSNVQNLSLSIPIVPIEGFDDSFALDKSSINNGSDTKTDDDVIDITATHIGTQFRKRTRGS